MPKVKNSRKKAENSKKPEVFDVEKNGLKPVWIKFIDEYIDNGGNGTKAYEKAYKVSYDVANASAPRLLVIVSVKDEIRYRLDQQKMTDSWVYSYTREYANKGLSNEKYAMAGVKAVEMAGKMRGMLIDTKRYQFDDKNPAVVLPVIPIERAKKIREAIKGGGVIE